jgi:hypothetical protein
MTGWIFKKIRSILLIPILSVTLFFAFFFYYLNPDQRKIIFQEVLASIPGAKNFVNINYKNQLAVTAVEDTKILKTAFYSVDYLGSIRDPQGHIYIAVYPFQIEAGFDLEHSDAITSDIKGIESQSVRISLPPPMITTLDLDENKQVLVVRDNLKGDYDYVLRPVKKAFELQARDYAIRNGILERAEKNAIRYYEKNLGSVYDKVQVVVEKSGKEQFCEYIPQNIPVKFSLCEQFSNYRFDSSDSFNTFDGYFEKENSRIYAGYSNQSNGSFKHLWKNVAENSSRKAIFKFIDPEAPLENGVVCEYDQNQGTCYTQKKGNLFYLNHSPSDAEQAKLTLADLLYLSFNVQYDQPRQSEGSYFNFIKMLSEAKNHLEGNRFSQLERTALNILKIEDENAQGKLLLSVAHTFNSKTIDLNSNSETIGRMLKLYKLINNNYFEDVDRTFIEEIFQNFNDPGYSKFLNNFRSILIMNKDKLDLSETELKSYIKSLAESGHLTHELLLKIPPDLLAFTLKVRINQINEKLSAEGKTDGNMVFCDSDGKTPYWGIDQCSENVYYDRESIKEILNQGKSTASNKLYNIFQKFAISGNPEDFFAIVLTRKKHYVITEYDLFVFTKNLFYLVVDFMDDIKNENFLCRTYSQSNPGVELLNLEGRNYRNTAFLTLINELHDVSKSASKGTRKDILDFLKTEITNETIKEIQIPTVMARK